MVLSLPAPPGDVAAGSLFPRLRGRLGRPVAPPLDGAQRALGRLGDIEGARARHRVVGAERIRGTQRSSRPSSSSAATASP
jgi:hypothetical protein